MVKRARPAALALVWVFACAAGQPAQAQARKPTRVWELPRVIQTVDVPGRAEAAGIPVAIHAVRCAASPAELERSLRRQFVEAGLYIAPARHIQPLSTEVQFTGLDTDDFVAYTVFLQPNGDGTTTVILSESFLAERKPLDGERPAVVMPGARGLLTTRTEGAQVLHYRVTATAEEVRAFHQQLLAPAGYRKVEPDGWARGGEVARLRLGAPVDGEVEVTLVLRAAGGPAEEGGAPW